MKVIVRCANNRVTKADMEREIERLFQENKDLRVYVGHLRDELNLAQQQSEARRKVICSSQGMNAMVKFWEEAVNEKNKAEERAEEYRIALMESDYRVAELEKQLEWGRNKNEEWAAVAQDLRNTIDEMKAQKEADDKKCEETCTACNELYEDVLADRNHLRGEVERLTYERDTAVNGNAELIEENAELRENLDAATNIRVEYAQEIDRLRKVVTNLQSTRFTTDEFIRMITRELMPSTGNSFANSVDF